MAVEIDCRRWSAPGRCEKACIKSQSRKKAYTVCCPRKGGPLTMAETTYLEAIRQAMSEEMDRDPAVVLIGEDVGVYGGAFKTSEGLLARFGWERGIDTT